VRLSSLGRTLLVLLLVILFVYLTASLLNRKNKVGAVNSAIVFLVFFHTYGILYEEINRTELINVSHMVLLPLYFSLAVIFSYLVTKLSSQPALSLWRVISLVILALTVVSVIRVVPHEVTKYNLRKQPAAQISVNAQPVSETLPDIYYLVFDELAGFESMREYFHNQKADEFKTFLKDREFHVFEESRSSDIWSIHQIATRLNYFDYEYNKRHEERWLYSITNNKAFALVESKGYTTVVLEQLSWFFPTMPAFRADHVYDITMFETVAHHILYDDFLMMVADKTMFYPLNHEKDHIETKYKAVRQFNDFAIERVANLEDIRSPRFVYMHLLMPHWPYLYDADGNPVHHDNYREFDYYEGYYEYTIKAIENMVIGLMENADPENPPVIVLQSDHGVRVNYLDPGNVDYPEEFGRDIFFAMYTPGMDASQLPTNIDPINTLPIVFNHYLGENIPLR